MKKKQWLKSLEGADDRYVLEAAPTGVVRKRSHKALRIVSVIAACLAFVLLFGTIALFIPYSANPLGVVRYANSDYYAIIQKLNAYTNKPSYKNTFELLLDVGNMFFGAKEESDLANGTTGDPGDGSGGYREITDNQVAGVIEADLIKRSDTHIYYLSEKILYVYSIEGQDSRLISAYNVAQYGVEDFQASEFYLSSDCKTLTIISNYSLKTSKYHVPFVKVIALDVSDPSSIQEISNVDVSGGYLSSRLTEHGLLLMTRLSCSTPDFSDERTFIPQVETADGMQCIAPDSIICPDTLSSASYTVMLLMDATGTTVKDSAAFLSYSEQIYVSADAIYATRSYREYGATGLNCTPWYTVSEISCLGYGADGFEERGSFTVDGSVLNQYSMDEFNGMLRVATTTQQSAEQVNEWGLYPLYTSANLYVIDLATMEIAASVLQFAPVGETVRSARFDGNMAYVCTAVGQTDPVFFFDLSDLENIEVKETGTIAGFSTSLVNFADGYLLGIGQGDAWNTLKIEIYTESETGVDSYCKYELEKTEYYSDYKCYYIDRKNGLVGLGICSYANPTDRFAYIVLHFDGETITEVLRTSYGQRGSLQNMRGVYIDGYFYVLYNTHFDVTPLALD